ncbi:MAG TPA: 16S rRNA (cytidine(1402)-2'-O)-methyltransferase [Ktedonobacterales bacterium]|nr:16S rRNA (cytidine(1402)-2'-O)-methyltransferase [Ktedonobacterales bacterium]
MTMGTLYLVATPIGNLEDMTLRGLRVLREVSLIAAEDTRHTRKLLTHFQITTPTVSYHEHSSLARRDALLEALSRGDVALVSDAGTPLISDPGQDLVRAALSAGHAVIPIPGAVAAIAALIGSGLPADQFTFLGFLPRRSSERRALLESVRREPRTLILYEAPHRLVACLEDALAVLGDREIVAARELTKLHEEWLRGPISALLARFHMGPPPRGEFALVLAGYQPTADARTDDAAQEETPSARERIRALLAGGMSTRDAATRIAGEHGISRREAYALALEVARETEGEE